MNEQQIAGMIAQILTEQQGMGSFPHLNADEQGVIFARDLISMSKEVYMEEMPAPVAIHMFAQEPGVTPGSKYVGYRMYSAYGMAKIMAAFGTDMPMMSAKGKEFFATMYTFGLGYGYTYEDIMAAVESGTRLSNILAVNTREAHERTISNVIWNGDAEYQIVGFLDHPNIPQVAVSGGWSTATDDVIRDDISAVIAAVNSSKIYNVTEFQFPSDAWTIVQGKVIAGTDSTILSFLRKAYPEITFSKNYELDDEGVCMAIQNTRRHFAQATPVLFRQLTPQPSGLDISIPCLSRTAGVINRAPLAAAKSSQVV